MADKYTSLFSDPDHVQKKGKKKTDREKLTSEDVPGTGTAKKTAKAIEKRQKYLDSI